MIKVKKDLTGFEINDIVVLRRYDEDYVFPSGRKMSMWWCKCKKCGMEFALRRQDLITREFECECQKKKCVYDLYSHDYGIGYTSKGEEFWFDLDDYEKIKNYTWHYDDNGYVRSTKDKKHIRLHRLVMNVDDETVIVDHIKHPARNEHKIDNRKSNLRIVTPKDNVNNASLAKNNTSGVTGVYWKKDKNKWEVKYPFNNKLKHIGYYDDFKEAVKVRKELERKYQGEFSYDISQSI